jgi:YfiH family protein
VTLIRWGAPGPYVVAFTTRLGGVSTGAYESLNLGARGDDPARVAENRRIACDAIGLDAENLSVNHQRHSPTVHRAEPGIRDEPGDGLWSDVPGQSMLALSADCLTIAVATTEGAPRLAILHAGWRGLADGIVGAAVEALGPGALAACVGPAIGPCCYEVGPEVSERFDADLTRGRVLDLWTAAERALRNAGIAQVERVDLCTRCNPELFFSHRRQGKPRGAQGVVGLVA